MDALVSLLTGLTLWHWLGLGIILLTIEIAVGTFDLLWVAIAAFLTALYALSAPEALAGWQAQLIFFSVAAIGLVILGRTAFRGLHHRASTHPNLNDRMAAMVGQLGEARSAFEHGRGRVRIGDTEWEALLVGGHGLEIGTEVRVTGADGGMLRIERA